jgi:hypothetical protein
MFELNSFTVPGEGNPNKKQNKTWISITLNINQTNISM